MKIVIVGPGAMGCFFGSLLSNRNLGHDLWLLDKRPERVKSIKESGIIIEGATNLKQAVNITADPKLIGTAELVVIATKSYDTESALSSAKALLSEQTNILSLQNGIGNLGLILDMVGEDRAICGTTAHGVIALAHGRIRHTGKGETIIGRSTGKIFRDLRYISNIFNQAGVSTKISKDVNAVLWSKLIINAGINPLSALCRLRNGMLLKNEGIKELMRQAVVEAAKVAKKNKVKLIYDDPLQKMESICKATDGNISSMLQDVLNKKRTEIDSINGAVSRYAKSSGVKTPVNDMLTQLLKAIEENYKEQVRV
jgi:2-dehydropantoate 2-reductase